MRDEEIWVSCPICGKRLFKYKGGAGNAVFEIKCSGKGCGRLITVYSAGKTACRDTIMESHVSIRNSEGYLDITAYTAISKT